MISAYLKYFDLNNFFIINFESEVVQNLDQTFLKLSKFLKIDLSNLDYEIHSNKSGKPKYKLLQNIITNKSTQLIPAIFDYQFETYGEITPQK